MNKRRRFKAKRRRRANKIFDDFLSLGGTRLSGFERFRQEQAAKFAAAVEAAIGPIQPIYVADLVFGERTVKRVQVYFQYDKNEWLK